MIVLKMVTLQHFPAFHNNIISFLQQGGLRRELTDMRMMADQEVVARIELESQIQSRDDEIEFLKRTYEEKIKILMEADQGDYQVRILEPSPCFGRHKECWKHRDNLSLCIGKNISTVMS